MCRHLGTLLVVFGEWLLAREEPDQDDHEDYGDNADDGAGEFDA